MTLDDLEKEFWGGEREQPVRVRLARVVKALRDEIVPERMRISSQTVVHASDLRLFFREILGEAEAAAGGPARKDGSEAIAADPGARGTTPAANPASVCEWKALSHSSFMRQCSKYPTSSSAGPYCSNCGKTIVEAK